jgi:hypothetical protein
VNLRVPRSVIIAMGSLFTVYNVLIALIDLPEGDRRTVVIVGIVAFAAAMSVVLTPYRGYRLPLWAAVVALILGVAVLVLTNSAEAPASIRWSAFAVGSLFVVLSIRRRAAFGWLGIVVLVVQTIVLAGPAVVVSAGVAGAAVWVGIAHILIRSILKAAMDGRRFALAEREATDWQAAQEAHVFERQLRLGQTSSMALAMLRRIELSGGELTEEERQECLRLEAGIRDEIRGRRLLDDDVRRVVLEARRRGATVSLLDEGGIDELDDAALTRVHGELARGIAGSNADRFIARTVAEGSDVAVTLVGLHSPSGGAAGSEDEEIAVWLEIPRSDTARESRPPVNEFGSGR